MPEKEDTTKTIDKHEDKKWEDLAIMIKDKTSKRMDDINLLTSKASVIIAAIAFLLPSILESKLNVAQILILTVFIMISFIFMSSSLFATFKVPIDANKSIKQLDSGDLSNASKEEFDKWKAKSYAEGLQGINTMYEKQRKKQILSFLSLGITIVLLIIFNCGIISDMKNNDSLENPTQCTTQHTQFINIVEPSPSIDEQQFSSNTTRPEPEPSTELQRNDIK